MVEARWGHINRDYSLLTEVQSIMLDGHFIMEHGRAAAPGASSTSTTAGVWRRDVIADAGGLAARTPSPKISTSPTRPSEGWRFVYLPDLVSPAELPVEMNAFQTQQQRWAKGSVQVCKEAAARVLASDLPWRREGGGDLPPHREPRLPLMVLLAGSCSGDDHALHMGSPRCRSGVRSSCRHRVRLLLLPDLAEGAVPRPGNRSSGTSQRCSDRDRPQHQQRAGGDRGPLRQALEFTRTPKYRIEVRGTLEAEGLPRQGNWCRTPSLAPSPATSPSVSSYAVAYGSWNGCPSSPSSNGLLLHFRHVARPALIEWLIPGRRKPKHPRRSGPDGAEDP